MACGRKLVAFVLVGGAAAVQHNVGIRKTAHTSSDTSPPESETLVETSVGRTAELNEGGYKQVMAATTFTKSKEEMSIFVHRLCDHEGLRIADDGAFEAFEKYFDGECATQTYSALHLGLHEALRKPSACGGGWVVLGPGKTADENRVSLLRKEVSTNERTAVDSVLRLVHETRNPNLSGASAAYDAMTVARNDDAMKVFIRGTIAVLGGDVHDEGGLSGFVHWYSGINASQSYQRLKQELYEISKLPNAWIKFEQLGAKGYQKYPNKYCGKDVNHESHIKKDLASQEACQELCDASATCKGYHATNADWKASFWCVLVDSDTGPAGEACTVPTLDHKKWDSFFKQQHAVSGGEAASLNEEGYRSVAKTNDHNQMAVYIHRLLDSERLKVADEAKVQGLIPWYTAECGVQSYAALRKELLKAAGKTIPGEAAPKATSCGGWVSDA